jgi:hypothetical protein
MRPKQQTHMGIAPRNQWGAPTYLEGGNEHGQTHDKRWEWLEDDVHQRATQTKGLQRETSFAVQSFFWTVSSSVPSALHKSQDVCRCKRKTYKKLHDSDSNVDTTCPRKEACLEAEQHQEEQEEVLTLSKAWKAMGYRACQCEIMET